MGHFSYITLFLVVGVNIAFILVSCMLSTTQTKHSNKGKRIASNILLVSNFFVDVGCCVWFWLNGAYENNVVFVLFIPLTLMLLMPDVKE